MSSTSESSPSEKAPSSGEGPDVASSQEHSFSQAESEPFGEVVERSAPTAAEPWTFAGWGKAERLEFHAGAPSAAPEVTRPHTKLGQWSATAICGNDITSSVLYVTALCTIVAGVYAPISLAMVGVVLFLFRRIYEEVGSALPLNGGAYNVLLNTTSKYKASIAACLTLLSYVATAVISSTEALHYAHGVWHRIPVVEGSVVLLGMFAFLNIIGIKESAGVALVIFLLHIATLIGIVVSGAVLVSTDISLIVGNFSKLSIDGAGNALFLGFSAGLLGISGFESSANFIEEQAPGVFPKTLRNMWAAVFFFNTSISVLALGLLKLDEFPAHQETLLAEMGGRSLGPWFASWIGINAVLVLSGAVLTSYVGVTGLVRRMALDRCLPRGLLHENKFRRTPHWIPISFFLVCVSILAITRGNVATLAGVYTISFLGVMSLFAIGNRLLAVKRGRLPRSAKASWPGVVLALLAVMLGLSGNIIGKMEEARLFIIYFAIAMTMVTVMFARVTILKWLLYMGRAVHEKVAAINRRLSHWTLDKVNAINSQSVVFFTRGDSPANLRRAIEYVLHNEQTRNLKVVHVYQDEEQIPKKLAEQLHSLDEIFPEIRIDFLVVKGRFGPELIQKLSAHLDVPQNYMFIGCPGDRFPHNLADLGGVRLIV